MQILSGIIRGFTAGEIGLLASKISNISTEAQIGCNAGMTLLTALSMREKRHAVTSVLLGMLLPTALDLVMQYGFGLDDYVRNPVNVAILIAFNLAQYPVDVKIANMLDKEYPPAIYTEHGYRMIAQ